MRRTRHVVLPVRSWQYIGLLLVSLACLTLGHVSRDREGRAGSLAGPELKHTAPHEVDACPNGDALPSPLLPKAEIASSKEFNRSPEHRLQIQERFARASRRVVEKSADTRDLRSRIAGRRDGTDRHVRAVEENRRLMRSQNSRSEERWMNDRRSVSLDRRISGARQIRDLRERRVTDPSRLLQRRSSERRSSDRQSVENRDERRAARTDRTRIQDSPDSRARSAAEMRIRNVRNFEAQDLRMNRKNERVVERRDTNSAERQQRLQVARRTISRFPERSLIDRNIESRGGSRLSRIDGRRANVGSDERRSVDRLHAGRFSSHFIEWTSNGRTRRSNLENQDRLSIRKREVDQMIRSSDRLRVLSLDRQGRLSRERLDAQRLSARDSDRLQRLARQPMTNRRSSIDKRSSDPLPVRTADRQDRLARERTDIRRSTGRSDNRRVTEHLANLGRQERLSRERRSVDQNSDRLQRSQSRKARSHSETRREISWMDSLRRINTIPRVSRVSDAGRRQAESSPKRDRRRTQPENRENSVERRTRAIDDNRRTEHTRLNKNYLITVPHLITKQPVDNENFEFLRQIFVLALCTMYAASIVPKKNGFVKNILSRAARSLAW